jgi:hypothetical protein
MGKLAAQRFLQNLVREKARAKAFTTVVDLFYNSWISASDAFAMLLNKQVVIVAVVKQEIMRYFKDEKYISRISQTELARSSVH